LAAVRASRELPANSRLKASRGFVSAGMGVPVSECTIELIPPGLEIENHERSKSEVSDSRSKPKNTTPIPTLDCLGNSNLIQITNFILVLPRTDLDIEPSRRVRFGYLP
jgi:hypothetical protein